MRRHRRISSHFFHLSTFFSIYFDDIGVRWSRSSLQEIKSKFLSYIFNFSFCSNMIRRRWKWTENKMNLNKSLIFIYHYVTNNFNDLTRCTITYILNLPFSCNCTITFITFPESNSESRNGLTCNVSLLILSYLIWLTLTSQNLIHAILEVRRALSRLEKNFDPDLFTFISSIIIRLDTSATWGQL